MLPKRIVTDLDFGEIKRNPKKVSARHIKATRKGVVGWKRVRVEVSIQRNWTGDYVGLACVMGTKGRGRGGRSCPGSAVSGKTPTQAFNKALAALAHSRK